MKNFSKLEKKLGLEFKNKDLLKQALVHRSYLNENPSFSLEHNERLEFLGDAVLELIVSDYLYKGYEQAPEGDLTNWRASLVNSKMLAELAEEFVLEDFLYLSKGEAKDKNTKARQYILANAFEALIGSIYLDQGLKKTTSFLKEYLIVKLDYILEHGLYMDPKSRFQELAQEKEGITPTYKVLSETGPDHDKVFKIGVYLENKKIAVGTGSSKQEAQVKAAAEGLKAKKWS